MSISLSRLTFSGDLIAPSDSVLSSMSPSNSRASHAVTVKRGRIVDTGCSCDVINVAGRAEAYNEQGFRYFLEVERKRARLSSRPSFLLLVDFANASASSV